MGRAVGTVWRCHRSATVTEILSPPGLQFQSSASTISQLSSVLPTTLSPCLSPSSISNIFHTPIRFLSNSSYSNQCIKFLLSRVSQFRIGLWRKGLKTMSVINANSRKTELCVFSYNSRGFGALKQEYCRQLISRNIVGDKIPIVCNQENFILRNNSYKTNNALPSCHILIKPSVKESHTSRRPKKYIAC